MICQSFRNKEKYGLKKKRKFTKQYEMKKQTYNEALKFIEETNNVAGIETQQKTNVYEGNVPNILSSLEPVRTQWGDELKEQKRRSELENGTVVPGDEKYANLNSFDYITQRYHERYINLNNKTIIHFCLE